MAVAHDSNLETGPWHEKWPTTVTVTHILHNWHRDLESFHHSTFLQYGVRVLVLLLWLFETVGNAPTSRTYPRSDVASMTTYLRVL